MSGTDVRAEGEASGETVRQPLHAAQACRARVYLSRINWGELRYIVAQREGLQVLPG